MNITKDTGKNFAWVLEELHNGRSIRKGTWNFHEYIKLEFIANTQGTWSFIKIRIDNSGNTSVTPWLASYSDIVAGDWGYV